MDPKLVKPFVRHNKSDKADAEGVYHALVSGVRAVAVKTETERDIQTLLTMRALLVKQRTARINHVRGLLAEYGHVMPKSVDQFDNKVDEYINSLEGDAVQLLIDMLRDTVKSIRDEHDRIKTLQREISRLANQTRNAKHFLTVPGIGETIMAYMCVLLADPAQFSSGRQFAAYLGLVPMHTGSGGKTVTTKIPGRCESSASFVGTGSSCGGQVEMPDRLGEDHFGKETQEGGNGCHRQPHGTPVLGGGKQGTGLEKDAC